jgi:hypothetical protein
VSSDRATKGRAVVAARLSFDIFGHGQQDAVGVAKDRRWFMEWAVTMKMKMKMSRQEWQLNVTVAI